MYLKVPQKKCNHVSIVWYELMYNTRVNGVMIQMDDMYQSIVLYPLYGQHLL